MLFGFAQYLSPLCAGEFEAPPVGSLPKALSEKAFSLLEARPDAQCLTCRPLGELQLI